MHPMSTPRDDPRWRARQRAEYIQRINRVMDYVESHLDGDLSLSTLAKVANFSACHFHRVFGAMVGERLNQFIGRVRVERAADKLLANPTASVTEIALDCGYSGSATFARAFRDHFQMSASQWRSGGFEQHRKIRKANDKNGQSVNNIGKDDEAASGYVGSIEELIHRRLEMTEKTGIDYHVDVREMEALEVAYVRHVGPYQGDSELFAGLFGRLCKWAGPRDLLRFPETKMLCVYHDNPNVTDDDKLRVSCCVTVPPEIQAEGEIGRMTVPGGKFAAAHVEVKSPEQFGLAWTALMGEWLPESGYQPDDRLCYELYLNDPNTDPEGRIIVDICVPIRPL